MLCRFVVLRSIFTFPKAVVWECAFAYVILVLCHTTEDLGNSEWPTVQCFASVCLVHPLLPAGLFMLPATSIVCCGVDFHKTRYHLEHVSCIWLFDQCIWIKHERRLTFLVKHNVFASVLAISFFKYSMQLSKCWLLSAELDMPTLCISGSYWNLQLEVKAKLDSERMACYNREHSL